MQNGASRQTVHATPNGACNAKRCMQRPTVHATPNGACNAKRCMQRQTVHAMPNGACNAKRCMQCQTVRCQTVHAIPNGAMRNCASNTKLCERYQIVRATHAMENGAHTMPNSTRNAYTMKNCVYRKYLNKNKKNIIPEQHSWLELGKLLLWSCHAK